MDAVEFNLPKDLKHSFIVFREKGQFFPAPWHYHEHYELVLVTQSSGNRMVGDHIGRFRPDDLVFMGSMLPHVWVNDDKYFNGSASQEADAIVIHFVNDFLGEEFMSAPEMDSFRQVLTLSQQGLEVKGEARQKINTLMKEMLNLNGLQRLSNLFSIFNILSFYRKEFDVLASPSFIQNLQTSCTQRFSNITEYVLRNYDKDITLQEISGVANMSVTAFCNYFKKQFRMTFVEYLNSFRIGQVCDLLSESEKNVAEIAYECGFNNISNFNRQFKKYKNMTPSCYRNSIKIKHQLN